MKKILDFIDKRFWLEIPLILICILIGAFLFALWIKCIIWAFKLGWNLI